MAPGKSIKTTLDSNLIFVSKCVLFPLCFSPFSYRFFILHMIHKISYGFVLRVTKMTMKKINLKFIFVFFNQSVDAECVGHHIVGRDYQKSNNG